MAGDPSVSLKNMMRVIDELQCAVPGSIALNDAQKNDFSASVFATDPPYYDNIAYADLSDYFYVWLRRSLSSIHPDLFRRVVTPKNEELI
jgi:putative DNA methylase